MALNNRYRIIELIAQGGFSKTFLAVDELKSPALSCVVKQFLVQSQEKNITIFEEDARKLKELGQHPQIPALLDFFELDGFFYLVQEFVDGMNLAKVVELEGVLNESQVWDLLNNLLPVLKFIHDRDVIHGDIKPANIIRVGSKAEPWGMRSQAEPGSLYWSVLEIVWGVRNMWRRNSWGGRLFLLAIFIVWGCVASIC